MKKPKYKIDSWVYITRKGEKPSRFFSRRYQIKDIFEHDPPLPATNYYGIKLDGRYVYGLNGYTQKNGWLPEEEITAAPPKVPNVGEK